MTSREEQPWDPENPMGFAKSMPARFGSDPGMTAKKGRHTMVLPKHHILLLEGKEPKGQEHLVSR